MDGTQTLVWYISTLFSFHISANVAGISDVEEQWLGLEKSLCSSLGETKQPALSLERSCPEEVALKRVKRINGWLNHENVSVR